MKRRLMKVLALGLVFTLGIGLLAGCSKSKENAKEQTQEKQEQTTKVTEEVKTDDSKKETESRDVTLEIEYRATGAALDAFRMIVDDFVKETGIKVDLVTPGDDYETVMKTRMASGDMPDVFVTHGWSIARYKEYLTPLTNEEWYGSIEESILPVISDENGDIFVLPVTQDGNVISYNATVLENAGVKVEDLTTMDAFMEACEKIKASGVTPIYVGGKATNLFSNTFNTMAATYYVPEGSECPQRDALKDGTFDWDKYGNVFLEAIAEMIQKGYYNDDYFTADRDSMIEAIGSGKCGFVLCGGMAIHTQAKKVVPEADVKFMPIPGTGESGKMCYFVGEGSAFGIWKDTEYMDEAKTFLNYLARPDISIRVMESDGWMPALTTMSDGNSESYEIFKESQKIFEGKILYNNIFDREFMPSGMYPIFGDALAEVFMDPTEEGINVAREILKENYIEKYAAAATK